MGRVPAVAELRLLPDSNPRILAMSRFLLTLLAASAALLPAQDDRDRQTPVGAIWQTDVTPADAQTLINQGWRFTDIEIESSTTWEFTVSAVQNTGSYAKGWWWVYGVTSAQLTTTINANNARIVDLEAYDDAGTIRYAAILISNTGADAKSWWWYTNQTSAQVQTNVNNNNGRLTSFERYTTGGVDRWATVMISNTGADARSWGYLFGASTATIDTNVNQNGNRIYSLERVGTDSHDVILMQNLGFGWWWYPSLTAAALTEVLQQNIGRLVDVERYSTLAGTAFVAVVVDNANTLERTVRQEFFNAPAASLGDYGFFLKEVNGPILAQMRPDTVFEPASTMKTLYHVHAMRRVLLNAATLGQLINKPTACGVPGSNQSLSLTLRQMMENSDNYSTLAISNFFGLANINATANSLGMSSTNVNFTIGCQGPSPESELTLRDLTTLHEQVANGYLGNQRDNFYDLMANGSPDGLTFPSWGTQTLNARINAEAVALGFPASVRDAFKARLDIAYKPGGIGWTNPGPWTFYFAEGGYMKVPFKTSAGVVTYREYTFGVFNYLFTGAANEVPGRNAMGDAELELVWDRVKAAMATWDNYVSGQLTTLPGAGCAGSSGTPAHSATGTPEVGETVNYTLTNAPTNALCLAMFGFDTVTWNGLPLPVNLSIVGAPGCLLRINPVIYEAGVTSVFTGAKTTPVTFGTSPSLIGMQLYTQYAVYDPPANAFDWTVTNAIRTTLGGWL